MPKLKSKRLTEIFTCWLSGCGFYTELFSMLYIREFYIAWASEVLLTFNCCEQYNLTDISL